MAANDDLRDAWHRFCDDLKGAVDHVVDPDRQVADAERAEGVRHVLRMLSMQVEQLFENADPMHPELGWMYPAKMGQDNPDGLYQTAPMDLRHSYRLSGNVGSVRYLGMSIMTWTFGTAPIRQLIELDGSDLNVDDNGDFEVVFSPDPPPDGTPVGAWHQLEPLETRLLLRQFFSDWEAEVPADLHLECLDTTEPPQRLQPADVAGRLAQTSAMASLMASYWTGFGEQHIERGEINRFAVPLPDAEGESLGGTSRQMYEQCMWRVAPGEALLLSFTPPQCHYWEVQIGDRWYQSLDYINRQVTLNDSQAAVDDDGAVRIVISAEDPGVANWLDTCGVADGYITVRFNLADQRPELSLDLVRADDVDGLLPESTTQVSPEERRAVQRSRRRTALARFRR
jgi:hypothetical protein